MLFGAMFLNPGGFPPQLLVFAVSLTMLLVGFLWIRRITSFEEGPSRFRYQKVGRVRPPARTGPTFRWIATRAGMTAGLAALILPTVLTLFAPLHTVGLAPWWAPAIIGSGWLGLIVGNVWLYRIMRGEREQDPNNWRYRR